MVNLEKHTREIIRLYNIERLGCGPIGDKYGKSRAEIGDFLRSKGIELKKRGQYSQLSSLKEWKKEYDKHPRWKGINSSRIPDEKESGLATFYKTFRRWVQKNIDDNELRERASCTVLGFEKEILTPKRIDELFFGYYNTLDRIPEVREVQEACGCGLMTAIFRGRYKEDITTYRGYLAHHGLCNDYLPKEAMEAAFMELREEVGRNPLRKEIFHRYPSFERSLRAEEYAPGVKNYRKFLVHIGEEAPSRGHNYWKGHPLRIIRIYKTEKRIDPNLTRRKFSSKHPGVWSAIQRGFFRKDVTTWNGLKKYFGEKIKYPRERTWPPENVKKAFYEQKKELGRNPTGEEFIEKNGGAMSTIRRGTYNLSIRSYNQFLTSIGEKVTKIRSPRGVTGALSKKAMENDEWTKQNFIDAYNLLEKEKERRPSNKMFEKYYGPEPFKQMRKGRIEGIRNWNDLERIVNEERK